MLFSRMFDPQLSQLSQLSVIVGFAALFDPAGTMKTLYYMMPVGRFWRSSIAARRIKMRRWRQLDAG